LLETGIPLTLSQNFDSALSDVVIVQFKDGAFQSTYTGPGLSSDEAAELEDVIEVFNLQPNDLAAREAQQKQDEPPQDTSDFEASEKSEPAAVIDTPSEDEVDHVQNVDIAPELDGHTAQNAKLNADIDMPDNAASLEIITLEPEGVGAPEDDITSDDVLVERPENTAQSDDAASKTTEGPPIIEDSAALDICRIIGRDALGQIQEIPISAQGLQNTLETAPVFVFPTPPGLNLRAVKCKRDTLTPRANDYKVARAGYPFFYQVDGDDKRVAALEFAGNKFRMNLLEGDFTSQELIDAKARILSFNDQHLKDIEKQRKGTP